MSKSIYVVTNPELGWDCVVVTYSANSEEEVEIHLSELYGVAVEDIQDQYVITQEELIEIKFK